jgi:hypothetical protein
MQHQLVGSTLNNRIATDFCSGASLDGATRTPAQGLRVCVAVEVRRDCLGDQTCVEES